MQYHNKLSEKSLLAADTVMVHSSDKDEWYSGCRILKRNERLHIDLMPSSPGQFELPLPFDAVASQSSDGAIIVMVKHLEDPTPK